NSDAGQLHGKRLLPDLDQPLSARRRAVMEPHAAPVKAETGLAVDNLNLLQGAREDPPEIHHPAIVMPELLLQRYPRDEGGLGGVDAVKPLRKPGINVEPHG